MSDKGTGEVLKLENITRRYREGEGQLEVFNNLNMTLRPGEIVALVGPSGAGKSSLLHIAGLLEAPTSGEITVEEEKGLAGVFGFLSPGAHRPVGIPEDQMTRLGRSFALNMCWFLLKNHLARSHRP